LAKYETGLQSVETNQLKPIISIGNPFEVRLNLDIVIRTAVKSLNIKMDDVQLKMLVEDILTVYKHETFEDLVLLFAGIRRGEYGPTYGSLNMTYIRPAMEKYLEQKYERRERALHNERMQRLKDDHDFRTKEEYIEAVKRGAKNLEEVRKAKENKFDKHGYDNFKMKYLQKKEK
jgi:hypothetical protein